MKVEFSLYVSHIGYAGDPEISPADCERHIETDWPNGLPLPRKGEKINLDHLYDTPGGDDNYKDWPEWSQVFYDHTWLITGVWWEYDKETKEYYVYFSTEDEGK